ncbi:MAG: peptide ligase PGM1-related protein [Woeseiaceae bacterium]|nr:peptide ligase PGM1-related protein [Woeseiaceae bacterium]
MTLERIEYTRMQNNVKDIAGERQAFETLKPRLVSIWQSLQNDEAYEHTSVIVPSLSVNQDELAKITGAPFYEERLLFALIRLKNPNARVIYVTSQPVHPDIVEYYLDLLPGVPGYHARKRLEMLSVYDASSRPLSLKMLERPRFLSRLRKMIGDPQRAYLTAYNCTDLERRLAVALDVPLNGVDPDLLYHGTKSGSRKIFRDIGIAVPDGVEDLNSEQQIITALAELQASHPEIRKAVIKLNDGFAGEGNGVFEYPGNEASRKSISASLREMKWPSGQEQYRPFLSKFADMGGVVEEMIDADEVRSPSVQMRIYPDGQSALVSSHEQVLGGATGQAYLGCRFPASEEYRQQLQRDSEKIGNVLSRAGVVGRFGIDFLVCRSGDGPWSTFAIEINLRMCGTTPPFHALEFLTGGQLDTGTGLFEAPDGRQKFYVATDNLKSPSYRGLLPEDLLEIASRNGLSFDHGTDTGVLFYMLGALSQYGKLGMTCIGNSIEEADELFSRTVRTLDERTRGDADDHGEMQPLLDKKPEME